MFNMRWVAVLAVLTVSRTVSGLLNTTSIIVTPDGWTVYPCLQVNHRENNMDSSLMGLWYVVEIIYHREDVKSRGTHSYDICPKLNLYITQSTKQVKVNWHEKAGDVEYNFKMIDPENLGYWMVWGRQTGTLLNKVYEQFTGSVQVIEAQPTQMVLMFCSSNRTHYSLIMVRNVTIPQDLRDTHRALIDYGLPELSVRHTCKDEANGSGATTFLPILAVILSSLLLSNSVN